MTRRPRGRPATVDELFADLRGGADPERARAELIERHLPLARGLASRYRYTPQPFEDLVQVASLGLVKAVDRFDPQRGSPFASYAVATILGEIKRHMRDVGWAVHLPRAVKERVLAAERAERALSPRLGRAPTAQELAAEAGMSAEEVLEALSARLAHDAVPLDPPAPGEVAPAPAAAALTVSDQRLEAADDRLSLSSALRTLPPRERAIVRLRFIDGLTQTEIAERVGLSQMHVSRLLRSALETLRAALGDGLDVAQDARDD
jgi:RNA polymerase sigma-B factor